MDPTAILGALTQYLKSLKLPPKFSRWQPLIAFVVFYAVGCGLYVLNVKGAAATDPFTFFHSAWMWMKDGLVTTQCVSLGAQQLVNFKAVNPDSNLIPNTSTPK